MSSHSSNNINSSSNVRIPPANNNDKNTTTTTNNNNADGGGGGSGYMIGARLDGFPKDVMEMDIALYLSSLLYVNDHDDSNHNSNNSNRTKKQQQQPSDQYYYSITKVIDSSTSSNNDTTTTTTTTNTNSNNNNNNNTKSVEIALYCSQNCHEMFQRLRNKLQQQYFRSLHPITAQKCNVETGEITTAIKHKEEKQEEEKEKETTKKEYEGKTSTKKKNKKSSRKKKGDIVVSKGDDDSTNNENDEIVVVEQNTNQSKKKKRRRRKNKKNTQKNESRYQRMTRLAVEFHQYLLENKNQFQRCSNTSRDNTHHVFVEFYNTKKQRGINDPDTHQQHSSSMLQIEALVMTRLRQMKLARSKRRVGGVIIMNFAIDGTPGNFDGDTIIPSSPKQDVNHNHNNNNSINKKQQQVVPQQQTTTAAPAFAARMTKTTPNEHDSVTVRFVGGPPGFQIMDHDTVDFVMKVGEMHQVDLNILCDTDDSINNNNNQEHLSSLSSPSNKKEIYLDKLQLSGSHHKFYSLVHNHLPHLPIEINQTQKHLSLHVSVKPPNRVGVFRAELQCHFRVVGKSNDDSKEGMPLLFTIVRHFCVKSTHDKRIEQMLQPSSPYEKYQRKPRVRKHRRNKNQREDVLGPPALEYTYENPFKKLPFYSIEPDIVDLILAGELRTTLNRSFLDNNQESEEEDDQCNDKMIPLDGKYNTFWKNILWAYEFQLESDMELFDMENVTLQRDSSNSKYFAMTVPGLAEARPSVLIGDDIKMEWNGKKYKGRVRGIRLLDVIFESHSSFHKSFNPAFDKVDMVRFTLNRMIFRIMHNNLSLRAEHGMEDMLLVPNQKHVDEIRTSGAAESNARLSLSSSSLFTWANHDLNTEQQNAVAKIVEGSLRPLPYIIFGPPGTGKTTTVVEAAYQLAKHGSGKKKILLTAPSNEAADLLVDRLSTFLPPTELRRIISYSRSIDTVPASIRAYLCTEVNSPEKQLHDIMSARIVVSTLALSARFSYWGVPRGYFDVMVVDEAGQATEPELISVASALMNFTSDGISGERNSAGQLILAGDPRQLGPIVTSSLCREFGLDVSYQERLMSRGVYGRQADGRYPDNLLTKLVRNYRSHPSIIKLPNHMFYDNELECSADHMVSHSLDKWEYIPVKGFPVLFHAVEGENLRESNSPSWFNPQEAEIVVEYVNLLMRQTRPPLTYDEIGIITPYQRQAQKIRQVLKTLNINDIQVGSVESFQGRERRCIIVSTVRSESSLISSDVKHNLGFVANEKRFNVVMTRAKALLIVIGCPKVLSCDKRNWVPFLRYCRENNSWIGEDWDPNNNTMNLPEASDDDEWEIVAQHAEPSQTAEQSAFPIMLREE